MLNQGQKRNDYISKLVKILWIAYTKKLNVNVN